MSTEILTPVGRMVTGSCFEGNKTDAEGNPLVVRNGPNAGQPRVDYVIGIAIPKNDPGWPELYAKIVNEAKGSFPQQFDPQGNCINPNFAWKITDGDSQLPNSRGNKPCDREGFPGCWVLFFSSGYPPKCYTPGGEAVITDPSQLKRGDYIRVYGNVAGNESTQRPGIYLNHSMVERVGFGQEIVSGPSGEAVFGGAPVAQLPEGASQTPVAPAQTMAQPGQPAAPAQQQPGQQAPAQQPAAPGPAAPAQPQQPAAPIQPAPDFLNGPQGGQPAGPTPPPAQAEPKYQTPDGGQWTAEQLRGVGYTDQQIAALPQV